MKKIELIFKSALAGLLIGIAACIFVLISNNLPAPYGKIVGATMFSIGLISVILLEAFLFTGKVGYVDNKEKALDAVIGLLVNLTTAFLVGLLFRGIVGTQTVFDTRLVKAPLRLLLDGAGCGALIYIAVELYKKKQSLLVVVLPVIAFILAGMEHSIADIAYYGMCELTLEGLRDIIIVIIGNVLGSLAVRWCQIGCTKLIK